MGFLWCLTTMSAPVCSNYLFSARVSPLFTPASPQHTCVDENMTPKGYHLLRKWVPSSLATNRVSCTRWRGNFFPGGPRALTRASLSPPLQRLLGRSLNTQKKQKEQHVTLPSLYQQPTPELSTDTEWATVKNILPRFIHRK